MIENVENSSNSCKYCGCKFKQDIIEKIVENKELVICEFCGIEINIDILDTQEGLVKDPHKKISNHKDDIKKNKKTIIKRLGNLTKSRKYSVNVIRDDEAFPQIFKENLIIVISRLIYLLIREWEQENNVSVRRVSLNQSILTYLASKLKPILTKRISRTFLENLHNISIEEFDDSLKLLQKKVESNQDYRTHFLTFIIWLKKIVFRLVSDMWEMKNLPKLQATILKDLKSYSFYSPKLEEIVKRDTSKNDKIERSTNQLKDTPKNKPELEKTDPIQKTENKEITGNPEVNPHQNLHNHRETKECGLCHEIKSLSEFENYMKSNKPVYARYCKPCRLEHKQIRALQNKNSIIRNIYGGKFAEKCPECNTTVAKLPAFDFHHPMKELKTKRINFHGNWENTLKKLEKEKAIPSCRNCHLKKQSKYYKTYKVLIENKNDFESSIKNIEKKLYELIYKRFPDKGHKEGHQIKSWMSKRIVIDRLYNGKCIGCGEKNLATLQFHHRDISKKTFPKYDKLRYTTIEKIEKKLIQDDAVYICGNCHRMTEAYYFEKNHQKIVGTK